MRYECGDCHKSFRSEDLAVQRHLNSHSAGKGKAVVILESGARDGSEKKK